MADKDDRASKRLERLESKDLPYTIDTAKLLAEVPELDKERGLGRVLRELMQATEGNFKHLRDEAKRSTDYHNEHVVDSNFLKDDLVPHEHHSFGTKNQVGQDSFDLAGDDGHWILPTNFGGGDTDMVDAYDIPTFVPIYIDKPCTILQFRVEVIAPGTADQDLMFFVYAGDGDGNFPDTLLYDGTDDKVDLATPGYVTTSEFELNVGPGWIWVGICSTASTGVDAPIWSYDNGWNHAPISQGFWPFPTRLFDLDTGFTGFPSSISMFTWDPRVATGDAPPNPYMEHLNQENLLSSPFYSSFAPIIEYRVR